MHTQVRIFFLPGLTSSAIIRRREGVSMAEVLIQTWVE